MSQNDIVTFNTESEVTPKKIPICVLVPETSPILKEVMPEYDFNNQVMGDFKTAEQLASTLVETCKEYKGLGLSANQCGIKARVFVMGQGDEYIACFNPTIVAESTETVHMVEGCLSFHHLALRITRPAGIVVDYQDWTGKHHQANFVGISARCFLHELDHMNGIVYTDKVKPLALQQGMKKRDKVNALIKKAKKTLNNLDKVQAKLNNGNTN